jgi:hypothetical protein
MPIDACVDLKTAYEMVARSLLAAVADWTLYPVFPTRLSISAYISVRGA